MRQDGPEDRYLAWDACYNAREVGGYPTENGGRTRWHTIVRADNLCRLTPEGQTALRDYGVRTIIDLRLAHELEKHPNPFAAQHSPDGSPRYLNLPLHDVMIDGAIGVAQTTNSEYILIAERSKPQIAAVIKAVAENLEDGTVLVHCHGGKDRTGITVGLLLSLVGVPRRIICDDYALSQIMLEDAHLAWLEEQRQAQGHPVERPHWMFSPPEKMERLLEFLDREYGGVEGYLESAGVTKAEMDQIRKHLVAPAEEVT